MQENSTTQYAPFNSYNTCYSPSTGLFKQDIAVPKKTVTINGKIFLNRESCGTR